MGIKDLTGQLQHFEAWKRQQQHTLDDIEQWLKSQGLYTAQVQRALTHANLTLHRDQVMVAVVGEFSRGKTELINALFFSDGNLRLLPTDAGRTTMCPIEIFQDDDAPPYLRLLPIETRLEETSLIELQRNHERWHEIPLDLDDPTEVQKALSKIREHKAVPRTLAAKMGLSDLDEDHAGDAMVMVPTWRLARFNYRHPLLAQGLRILDTPGLNAISAEPELTYEMLPNAQARLFVLGADTGVTQSDLEMWQQLVRQPGSRLHKSVMVVLNKADTLWDELRSEQEVQTTLRRQCEEVSQILDITPEQVHAVSAQKGLLARVKGDAKLEARSGIPQLERKLAQTLIDNRHAILAEQSTETVATALQGIETLVASRLRRLDKQARELAQLNNRSEQAIEQLLLKAQQDKIHYQASINTYKKARADFTNYGKTLLGAIAPQPIEQVIAIAHKRMRSAWTTRGLRQAMGNFFDQLNRRMQIAANQSQEMRRLVRTIHNHFQSVHNMKLANPPMFSLVRHQVALKQLHQEAEAFRNSPKLALTEQHFAVRRYYQTIVSRVRRLFRETHNEAREWLETALDPLTQEIQEHRNALAQQLNDLKLSSRSRAMVRQRLQAIEREREQLQEQLKTLQEQRERLYREAPRPAPRSDPQLRVVSSAS